MATENKINLLDPKELEKLSNSSKPKEFVLSKLSLKYDKTLKSNYVVDSLEKAIFIINDYLKDSPNEYLIGIALDENRKPVGSCILGMGNSGHVDGNYNNIFKFIFCSGASSFVMVHNHPNAEELKPSDADLETFEELEAIGNKLDIRFRDFIIVGNEKQNRAYYSLSEKGVITQYDFIKRLGKMDNLEKPIELNEEIDKTIDEVNELLAESKYNSPDSIVEPSKDKSSKGFFGMFK